MAQVTHAKTFLFHFMRGLHVKIQHQNILNIL